MIKKYNRECPNCEKILEYSTESALKRANANKSLCRGCTNKKVLKEKGSMGWFKENLKGENNPFYGKTHTESTKEKIRLRDKSFFSTIEYKEKVSKQVSGKGNPMYGRTVYSIWVQKYGKDKADELKNNWIEKQKLNSIGVNNPMYGKPTPQGAGNGWSGWYKDWFFRSLRELAYAITLDNKKIKWCSAEQIRIKYLSLDGSERTYVPDFLVENKILVEVKPIKLQATNLVKLKTKAAIEYCKNNHLIYQLVDPVPLSDNEIKKLRNSNKIKFTDRYEQLYLEKF